MAKTIKTGVLHRAANLDRSAINADKRTVELSFSSELPVERWFGVEILDHNPKSVDLSRLKNGGPLLMDHNSRDQIGVVESAHIADRKGKAVVRFGNSQRAQEIFQDVQDGIRKMISVGYRVNTMVTEKVDKGIETMRATDWTPMEISLVSIPADPTVGVGRADGNAIYETVIDQGEKTVMAENNNSENQNNGGSAAVVSQSATSRSESRITEIENENRADRLEIESIGKRYGHIAGLSELADRAVVQGMSLVQFRKHAEELMPKAAPVSTAHKPLDLPQKDAKRYSLTKAIMGMMPGGSLDGIERELSVEIEKRTKTAPQGFWIPQEILAANQERSLIAGTGTLGGMVVSTPNLGSEFIELLRNKAQVLRLGARVLTLDSPVTIPRQNAAGGTNWVGETVAATLNTPNFTQITLQPQGISAFQQYGKQLLATSNPSIDALVRDDIMNIIGLAIDLAALHGTGSSQPTGLAATSGVGTVNLATNGQALGNSTAYPAMVSLETAVSAANADSGALAYLTRSAHRGSLKIAQRFTSTDSPVWTGIGNGSNDGMVNGYRAAVTNQIANNLTTGTATTITSAIFFGNWNDLLIGQFNGGATDLVVDPYTLAVNGVIRLIARHWVDIGVRHPASFAILGGII